MTKFFYYKHPTTDEIFSDQRMIGFEGVPYKTKDGVECELLKDYYPPSEKSKPTLYIEVKNKEVFQEDRDFVKKCNPKYIKFNDGHRERYDPSKHN